MLWEKQAEPSSDGRVLKRERVQQGVRLESTWRRYLDFRVVVLNAIACLGMVLWVYNRMPDYREHFEGHLVPGWAVH